MKCNSHKDIWSQFILVHFWQHFLSLWCVAVLCGIKPRNTGQRAEVEMATRTVEKCRVWKTHRAHEQGTHPWCLSPHSVRQQKPTEANQCLPWHQEDALHGADVDESLMETEFGLLCACGLTRWMVQITVNDFTVPGQLLTASASWQHDIIRARYNKVCKKHMRMKWLLNIAETVYCRTLWFGWSVS